MCRRFYLKISWKYNSLQILRVSGCFLPSAPRLHTESVFSSCWMVKFITSLPSRFGDLPSVFSLTCWGFTKTLVLSKAWHLGPTWGRHRIFIAFLPFSFLWALSLSTFAPAGPVCALAPTLCRPPEPRSLCDSDGSHPGCDLSSQVARSLWVACLCLVNNEADLPSI